MAKAIGVNLSVEDMYEKTLLVCTQTANNNSSMYSDILRKRSTEVDFINGYIAWTGEKQHVLVPINRCITKMIKAKEDLIQQYCYLFTDTCCNSLKGFQNRNRIPRKTGICETERAFYPSVFFVNHQSVDDRL